MTSRNSTGASVSKSSIASSNAAASATSSGPVATVTALIHKKSNSGKIAGIIIGSVAAIVLIAGVGFYFGRCAHHRHAQGKLSTVETVTGAYDSSNEPKGPAELATPLTLPVNTRHEMDSTLTSKPNPRFSELPGARHPAVGLPAEPIGYEK